MQGLEERADDSEPHVGSGRWVKVGLHGERFWCNVRRVKADGALVATVENNLCRSPYRCGDEIVLSRRHVLEIAGDEDRLQYERMCVVLGDAREAALQWQKMRAAMGLSLAVREGVVLVVGDECVST